MSRGHSRISNFLRKKIWLLESKLKFRKKEGRCERPKAAMDKWRSTTYASTVYFHYRSHAIRQVIFVTESHEITSTSTTSTSYKSLSVLRFGSTFSIFFFTELTKFFHKTPYEHSLRSIAPFSSPEAALLLVSTKNRDLWPRPTTFRF